MSYLVLARKLRPQTFDEIVGQQAVVRTLTNALSSGRLHHAFLLCGPRGTGKTSTARILAKALNCEQGPTPEPCNQCSQCIEITRGTAVDVQEIDGASNTGVDDVRQLRENARYLPVGGRRKIYIIDEVHMLSVSAFNALLKTLEEPPEHVTFIFATTEPHKIPVTILSRCQRYDLTRVSPDELVAMLTERLQPEGVQIDRLGLEIIATNSEGSVRDALSLVDQVVSYCGSEAITEEQVRAALGLTDRQTLLKLSAALLGRDVETAVGVVDGAYQSGQDLVALSRAFLAHLRDLVVVRNVRQPDALVQASTEDLARIAEQVAQASPELLLQLFDRFASALDAVARSETPKLVLEMAVVDLAQAEPLLPLGDLLARLETLEARLKGGGGSSRSGGPARGGSRSSGGARSRSSSPEGTTAQGAAPAPRSPERPPSATVEDLPAAAEPARPAQPHRSGVTALPKDPEEAWGVVVELLERHSRRLAANLYRAKLNRLSDDDTQLEVVLGLDPGSFEHQQLSGVDVVRELTDYLAKKLGKPARLVIEATGGRVGDQQTPVGASGGAEAPPAEPTEASSQPHPPAPRSLSERDAKWRRDEEARKRKEALSHPAVKDTTEILSGSVKEVHVVVD